MAASPKERFDAAIKVIHSLPKHGPFQPSNEMMLTFYGYFKQATEGPCTLPKPYMWDVVKKAKWDAWHKHGDMAAEVAMLKYVDELKKTIKLCTAKWNEMAKKEDPRIVEAMPQTPNVGDFMEKIGAFYEMVDEESPIPHAQEPNNHPPGGSTGSSPEHSQSESSTDQGKEDAIDFSLQVEDTLQMNYKPDTNREGEDEDEDEDEADAVPFHSSELLNGEGNNFEGRSLPQAPSETGEATGGHQGDADEREVSRSGQDLVSTDTDSEEEFCDSSDRPSQFEGEDEDITERVPDVMVTMSTPLKPAGKQNRVHFENTAGRNSNPDQNGRISPIMGDMGRGLFLNGGVAYPGRKLNGQISDSLIVQASAEGSMNLTSTSQLTRTQMDSDTDFSDNNSSLSISRGGEENAPPGGTQQPRGEGQVPRSSQGRSSLQRAGPAVQGPSGVGRRVLLTGGAGGGGGGEGNHDQGGPSGSHDNLNEQIALVVVRLQQDMNRVLERLGHLEEQTKNSSPQTRERENRTNKRWWWPFPNVTGSNVFFIIVWPVLVHIILNMMLRRRRR